LIENVQAILATQQLVSCLNLSLVYNNARTQILTHLYRFGHAKGIEIMGAFSNEIA
jgi:hypothetical protein